MSLAVGEVSREFSDGLPFLKALEDFTDPRAGDPGGRGFLRSPLRSWKGPVTKPAGWVNPDRRAFSFCPGVQRIPSARSYNLYYMEYSPDFPSTWHPTIGHNSQIIPSC